MEEQHTQQEDINVSLNTEETKKKLELLQEQAKELRKTLPRKARKQTLPQSLTDDEFSLIVKSLNERNSSKSTKVAFLLAYESGLRISEVLSLKKDDINLIAKSITIRQGKYSKDRVVPLPKTWKNWMINNIPIDKGVRTLQIAFKRAVKKSGLKSEFHFHCLRHSFATHCIERGMPINQLQLLMGHSSVSTTGVYIRANPKDALSKYEEIF